MPEAPVALLLQRCVAGDVQAWREIVERHRGLVWSVPLRLGLGEAEAAEVFQDVFESLLRNVGSLQDGERLSSWLYTAAKRLSLRRLGALRRRAQREERDEAVLLGIQTPGLPAPEQLAELERSGEVLRRLEELSERCRRLLEALFLDPDEPDYDQIAARLAIPRGSIGPTRLRCLQKLRESLGRDEAG